MPKRHVLPLGVAVVCAVVPLATAAPAKKALNVTVSGKGRVTSSPAGISCPDACRFRFTTGARVRVLAHPTAGWAFSRWSGGCIGRGKCTVTLSVPRAVRAVFAPIPPPPPPPGSSRVNPAPIGTPVAIATEDAPTGWALKVNSVTPDAGDAIAAVDPDNLPATPDEQYFMVSITATYTGTAIADAGAVPDGLEIIGASDISYQSAAQDGCGVLPAPDYVLATTDVTVAAGASVTGNICWPVSTDDVASVEMVSDQTPPVWFALH